MVRYRTFCPFLVKAGIDDSVIGARGNYRQEFVV